MRLQPGLYGPLATMENCSDRASSIESAVSDGLGRRRRFEDSRHARSLAAGCRSCLHVQRGEGARREGPRLDLKRHMFIPERKLRAPWRARTAQWWGPDIAATTAGGPLRFPDGFTLDGPAYLVACVSRGLARGQASSFILSSALQSFGV